MSESNNHAESDQVITNSSLHVVSLISGALWVLIGAFIIYFIHEDGLKNILDAPHSVITQIITGLLFGLIAGYFALKVAFREDMLPVMEEFKTIKIIRQLPLSTPGIIAISLTAGITEEILFRAALQPVLGIWIASALFVAIHGYFRFSSKAFILFGMFMFTLSMGLGLLFELSGLYAAMAAHAMYDFIVIRGIRKQPEPSGETV